MPLPTSEEVMQMSVPFQSLFYQGFSIHGNEPSGANAGLAYAYYLAAAEGS